MKLSRSVLNTAAAGGVVALMVAGAGAGYALASGTTIHACAAQRGGALRLANKCSRGERAVEWSVQGPPGPRGAPGANGKNGTNGRNGTNGTSPATVWADVGVSAAHPTGAIFAGSGATSVSNPTTGALEITFDQAVDQEPTPGSYEPLCAYQATPLFGDVEVPTVGLGPGTNTLTVATYNTSGELANGAVSVTVIC